MRNLLWKPVRAVRLENLSDVARDRIAQRIKQQYDEWKGTRRVLEDLWREIERHVEQFDPAWTPLEKMDIDTQLRIPNGFGSKLKMVNVYAHREGIVAAMMRYMMANDYDFFEPEPLDGMNMEQAKALKYYLMDVLSDMDYESGMTRLVREAVQYGTAFAGLEWVKEQATRWKRSYLKDPVTGIEYPIDNEAVETVYDAPAFRPMDIYYTVCDPTAQNMRTAPIIYRKALSPHEIMADQSYSDVTWNFLESANNFLDTDNRADVYQREYQRQGGLVNLPDAYNDKREVYEMWGDIVDGKDVYRNYVAETINGRLVRFEPNPYWMPHNPILKVRYCSESTRVYGRSPLASITGLQAAFDTAINQYLDYWTIDINRPLLVQANTIVKSTKNIQDRSKLPPVSKDSVWTVRDVNGVKRLDWQGKQGRPDPVGILSVLGEQMERATGDSELNSGGQADQYMKTGVAMTVADAGTSRFNLYAKTIEKEGVLPSLEMIIDLLRQMIESPVTMKRKDTPGGEEVSFDPALLTGRIRFTLRGASYNATKQAKVNILQQFYQTLLSSDITAPLMNWPRVVMIIGEALDIRGVRETLMPQATQMMDQIAAMQPSFWEKVRGFLTGQSPSVMQAEKVDQSGPGQQLGTGLAPATGGAVEGGNATSPFNPV